MLDDLVFLKDYIVILFAIIFAQSLVLNAINITRAKGYMIRAARYIFSYLCLVIGIEFIISAIIFKLSHSWLPFSSFWWAIFVGILAVLVPNVFEYFILLRNPSERKIRRTLVKLLRKYNLDIIDKFSWAIKRRMEQDAYDCQSGWRLKLSKREMGRRLRVLYSHHKRDIAKMRKDPTFLNRDVGFTPWENFYILAAHLGRRSLRRQLAGPISPPDPLHNWKGEERRKRVGTKNDRAYRGPSDPTAAYSRCCDNQDLLDRIRTGKD